MASMELTPNQVQKELKEMKNMLLILVNSIERRHSNYQSFEKGHNISDPL